MRHVRFNNGVFVSPAIVLFGKGGCRAAFSIVKINPASIPSTSLASKNDAGNKTSSIRPVAEAILSLVAGPEQQERANHGDERENRVIEARPVHGVAGTSTPKISTGTTQMA
jgi:hypothetical protein